MALGRQLHLIPHGKKNECSTLNRCLRRNRLHLIVYLYTSLAGGQGRSRRRWAGAAVREAEPLCASLSLLNCKESVHREGIYIALSLASSPCLVHSGCLVLGIQSPSPRCWMAPVWPQRGRGPWEAHSFRFCFFTQCLNNENFYKLRYTHL